MQSQIGAGVDRVLHLKSFKKITEEKEEREFKSCLET